MQVQEEDIPIIIDNGSFSIKSRCVFGEQDSILEIPNVVGRFKDTGMLYCFGSKNLFVGEEAVMKRGVLNLRYPVPNCLIEDWDDMIKVWEHVYYNELRVDPTEHPTILIESARYPPSDRAKVAEVMFQHLQVPKFHMTNQFVSSLHHEKPNHPLPNTTRTGLVVSSGFRSTHIVPVIDSKVVEHAVISLPVGGIDIEEYFLGIYQGHQFTASWEKEIVRNLKQQLFYVSLDPSSDKHIKKQFIITKDGYQIAVQQEQYQSCQILFQPQLLSKVCPDKLRPGIGLHEAVMSSILNVDEAHQAELMENIVLSGGNAMFPGLASRLSAEIEKLKSKSMEKSNNKVVVNTPKSTKYCAFEGARNMHSIIEQSNLWVSRQQYDEIGPNILQQK